MTIGITGHQRLSDDSRWAWVKIQVLDFLHDKKPLIGLSSLAVGADQLFAECVLQYGGSLVAVIPFEAYERTFHTEQELKRFNDLKSRAAEIRVLRNQKDDQESYLSAGKVVVEGSDVLLAVWDGLPAKGKGGTGDAVEYALSRGHRVIHINPQTQTVQELTPKQ